MIRVLRELQAHGPALPRRLLQVNRNPASAKGREDIESIHAWQQEIESRVNCLPLELPPFASKSLHFAGSWIAAEKPARQASAPLSLALLPVVHACAIWFGWAPWAR